MKRPERYPSGYFIPELIEDEDIIFNKDSDYHKQRKKEKKNPIFKRSNPKRKVKK
jgi:hypothetical protein